MCSMSLSRRSCRVSFCLLGCLAALALTAGAAPGQTSVDRIIDINPGAGGSYASYVKEYGGALYFRANDLPHGNNVELWRYDGTRAGKVAEINPSPTAGSDPEFLSVYDNKLYFGATDGAGQSRLWCYDGAAAAKAPGSAAGASLPEEMTVAGGSLYYRASGGLWKFDGASQTLAAPIGYPQSLHVYGGQLYFDGWLSSDRGEELCRYNITGAAAGTVEAVTDIYPGANGSAPSSFCEYRGDLYFAAYDGSYAEGGHGRELWKFDGTTATRIKDINTHGNYGSSNPHNMIVYKDQMYFTATDGTPVEGGHGSELWKYDGTNVSLVADINPTTVYFPGDDFEADSNPSWMCVQGGLLYFSADDGAHGRELWATNGTSTWLVADIYPGQYGSDVSELAAFQDKLFFSADDGVIGTEPGHLGGTGLFALAPEPATLALLALGGLGLLRRRRR